MNRNLPLLIHLLLIMPRPGLRFSVEGRVCWPERHCPGVRRDLRITDCCHERAWWAIQFRQKATAARKLCRKL